MLVPSDAGPGLTASEKILIVLFFLDVFSVTTSFVLLFLGSVTQETIFNSDLLVSISIVLGIYGSLSIICNILACYGIKKGKHYLLIPYLVFFPFVISFHGVLLTRLLWLNGVNYYIALPFIASLLLAYVWIKLLKQWAMLRHQSRRTSTPPQTLPNRWPEDADDNHVVENLNIIACYLSTGNMGSERVADLPPRYESINVNSEDLDLPPSYNDVVKGEKIEV